MVVHGVPAAEVAATACFIVVLCVVIMFIGLIIYQGLQEKAYKKYGYLAVLKTYPTWFTPEIRQATAVIVMGGLVSVSGVLIGLWYARTTGIALDSLIRWPW
jgi:hypothetical protein